MNDYLNDKDKKKCINFHIEINFLSNMPFSSVKKKW